MLPNEFTEFHKSSLEAFGALSRAAIDASEKLAQLNLAASKSLLNDTTVLAQQLSGAKDIQEVVAVAGNSAQPAVDKLVSYSRQAFGIANDAGSVIGRLVDAQVRGGRRQVEEFVDLAMNPKARKAA